MSRPARWPILVVLLISLVALGVSVADWLRPVSHSTSATPPAPSYSDQQVAEAKAKLCGAYAKVRRASDMNASRKGGDDATSQLVVAVNDRQIYEAGSAYLLVILNDEPAAPPELASSIRNLAYLFQVITLNFLASDLSETERAATDQATAKIEGICK